MDTTVISGILIISAIVLIMFAAYFIVETRRDLAVRGVNNPRIYFLAALMILVAVVEIGAAIFLLFRGGGIGGGSKSSSANNSAASDY